MKCREQSRERPFSSVGKFHDVSDDPDSEKRGDQHGRNRPAGEIIDKPVESEKKKSRKKCEKTEPGVGSIERGVFLGMPNGNTGKKGADDRGNPEHRGVIPSRIGFPDVGKHPSRE